MYIETEERKKQRSKELDKMAWFTLWSFIVIPLLYIFFGIMNDIVPWFSVAVSSIFFAFVAYCGVREFVDWVRK